MPSGRKIGLVIQTAEDAERCSERALAFAQGLGSRLAVISIVVSPSVCCAWAPGVSPEPLRTAAVRHADSLARRFATSLPQDVACAYCTYNDWRDRALIASVENGEFSVLLLGSHRWLRHRPILLAARRSATGVVVAHRHGAVSYH